MLVYLIVILLLFLFRNHVLGFPIGDQRNRIERNYLIIICSILILLAALRGSTVGTDTKYYLEDYSYISGYSFRYIIFDKYRDYPGLYLLAKTCSVFHFPVQLFFGIVEFLYVYAVAKFINRYSEDKLYSMLGFVAIGLYSFSLAGLKQTLSMAFVLFYYMALVDKKYVKTVLLALVAYFCHHASLVFLMGVALYLIRNFKLYYLYLVVIVAVSLFGAVFLWENLLTLLDNEHYLESYLGDDGYSTTTMIFYGVCLLFLFLFGRNYINNKKEESRIFLGLSTMAFSFQAFALVSSVAFRLSYYFVPFMIVGFPNDFNCIGNNDTKRLVKFIVAFMIIFVFIYGNRNGGSVVPYRFFWQQL